MVALEGEESRFWHARPVRPMAIGARGALEPPAERSIDHCRGVLAIVDGVGRE